MTHDEVRAVFMRVYEGGKNFMTPNPIAYGKRGRLLYELSQGTGIDGRSPLYGVTVIELDGTKRHDLSLAFHDRTAAERYIRNDFVQED